MPCSDTRFPGVSLNHVLLVCCRVPFLAGLGARMYTLLTMRVGGTGSHKMLRSSLAAARASTLRRLRRRQPDAPQELIRRAEFHATARREIVPLIGIGVLVLATAAHYALRAHRRVRAEEASLAEGGSPDAEGEQPRPAYVGKGYPVLGLDVGSLQACVAVSTARSAVPVVVENHEGRRTTPSFLTYEDGHVVIGQLAKRGRWRQPSRVVFNAPSLVGVPYSDALRPKYPFPVAAEGEGEGRPVILEVAGQSLSPREAVSRMVESLTTSAEHKLHSPPGYAVLAVPSSYSVAQKEEALKAVATGAGVAAVEVIDDATAALVAAKFTGAMGPKEEEHFDRPWAVVDVGGLLSQVSIVSLDPEHGLAVRAHETVETVGGEHLDAALVFHLVQEFRKKNRGLDLGGDYLALERLYDAAESTKMELSNRVSSSISLPFITADHSGPKHLDTTLTRSQYEAIVDPVLRRLQDPCLRVLKRANLTPKDLQGVLITGGSARLSFVRQFVSKVMQREDAITNETPEEAVALGACYFGTMTVDD